MTVLEIPLPPPAPCRDAFPAIADYAFLSDREATALVSPSGAVEWLCVPRPDGPSVFAAMLDRDAGSFRVGPNDGCVPVDRRYLPGTNVLETTWQTATGWLLVHDALLIGPWRDAGARDPAYRRPPEDHRSAHRLCRLVECIDGQVDLEIRCTPSFGYGVRPATWRYDGEGYGRAVAEGAPEDPPLWLRTDLRLGLEGHAAMALTRLGAGERAFVELSWGDEESALSASADEAAVALDATVAFWRAWLHAGRFPDHPWRAHLQRSALVLKGLQYAPTGALLAAPTTSLPETIGGERNWDYRYSWVRDSTFALWGLYTLGFGQEAESFFEFIREQIEGGGELGVMFGVDGERVLEEHVVEHLRGYEASVPVRVGNAAYAQQQHDVWGALLDSLWLHRRAGEYLSTELWDDLARQVEVAAHRWQEPDHGIWEVRGEPKHFTSSKVMCWVALDRGARLAAAGDRMRLARRWSRVAEEIRADVLTHGVDERGVLVQHYETKALDASTLLAVLMGFVPPDDDRAKATTMAIAEELTDDGLVLRYHNG